MKKIFAVFTAALLALSALLACSPQQDDALNVIVTVEPVTPTPLRTLAPLTMAPSPASETNAPVTETNAPATAAPSAEPTAGTSSTAAPASAPPVASSAPGQLDQSVFDGCAFVGNSIFEGLHLYGVITHGKFFTKVGLNLLTVYTDSIKDGGKPVIDELNDGSYRGVILMFGQNELGWPNPSVFAEKYGKLVSDIHARQSGARVFITGIPPVTKTVSDKNKNGVNNDAIKTFNTMLSELADGIDYCTFISVPGALYNSSGTLPEEASGDGIHLNLTYSKIWAEHILSVVSSALNG